MTSTDTPTYKILGLVAGPLVAALILITAPPEGLSVPGWWAAAIALWMAIWWMTEAIPLAATALLPLVCFPLLGLGDFNTTAARYAHPLIFLFLGGFLIARAVSSRGLDQRMAWFVMRRIGTNPGMIVAAIMMVTAFLSMWVSNTATCMVMLPIALSIVSVVPDHTGRSHNNFVRALLLGVAYAATIGGMGTIIGTPPNALFVAFMHSTYQTEISFLRWMMIGVPLVVILLPLTWILLTRVIFPLSYRDADEWKSILEKVVVQSSPITRPEIMVASVLIIVASCWIARPLLITLFPWLPLSDAGIAITGALAMFVIPVDLRRGEFILDWSQAAGIRWDVLILFGGGLALASTIGDSGLAEWLGGLLGDLDNLPYLLFLLLLGLFIVLVGELASNTAMAAVFLPIAGAVAVSWGESPLMLALPVALFATLGFMLPVATPPNAIVFGSGKIEARDMMRAGVVIDIVGIIVVGAGLLTLGKLVFGLG